jgi:ferredoxin-NADP reductase
MEHQRPFETYETTITKIEMLTPRVKGFRFQLPPGKEIHFHAGQFVQVFIPTPEKVRRTSYSIASPPQETNHVDLCVTLVREGVSSPFLHHLVEGNKLQVMGPLGKFTLPDSLPRDIVFIATGSGIAPFRSMILDLFAKNTPRNIYLVFGNRYEHDIIYRKEWEALAQSHPNFKFLFTLSQADSNWTGKRGYVGDVVTDLVGELPAKDFYICGLVKMIDAVSARLQSLGVPKEQIHFERYD